MATVNLDTAARLDIICRKGDTFELILDFGTSMDSSAVNWKMQIAPSDTESASLSLEGSNNFVIEANADGVAAAQVTITASSTEMAGLDAGLYVYDIQTDSNKASVTGGVVKTHLYGTFKVNEDVTYGTV